MSHFKSRAEKIMDLIPEISLSSDGQEKQEEKENNISEETNNIANTKVMDLSTADVVLAENIDFVVQNIIDFNLEEIQEINPSELVIPAEVPFDVENNPSTEVVSAESLNNDGIILEENKANFSSDEDDVNITHEIACTSTLKRKLTRESRDNEKKQKTDGLKFTKKMRQEKYENRNSGKSYKTLKGKEVRSRALKQLPNCRNECAKKLNDRVRQEIFNSYWSLGSRDKRATFVSSLVESDEPKTQRKRTLDPDKEKVRKLTHIFHFKVDGKKIKVCRGCFMKTLDETQMFVTLAIHNSLTSSITGVPDPDQRGKDPTVSKTPPNKLSEVRKHILSFPSYESHYTRRTTDKKYLPAHLNITILYDLYKNAVTSPVYRTIYAQEFHNLKLSFKHPKVDTCHKCDVLAIKMKHSSEEIRISLKTEMDEHHKEADYAYKMKNADKEIAKKDITKRCYTFDLQQCLPTPFLNSNVAFYKRQLWTFNLTFHECASGRVACYMWHEAEGGREANQIASCVAKELLELAENVEHVIMYSDSCGGQNRNSQVAAMFLSLMQKKDRTDHSRPQVHGIRTQSPGMRHRPWLD